MKPATSSALAAPGARRTRGSLALAAGLAVLAGCLSVPDEEEPQCELSSDCDQPAGEVCEEGVCWGDPPVVPLAAIIGPPGDAKDLVPAEIPQLFIPSHGLMSDLVLGTPVTFRGKVMRDCGMTVCPAVKATITVTRPSSFPGGPGLSLVETTAEDGTFVLHLPLTRRGLPNLPDDPSYAVTISPTDRGVTRPTLFAADAEEVPPRRMMLMAAQDATLDLRLPTGEKMVTGKVLDGTGMGLAGYRVAARGGWATGEPTSEVSTVAVTAADGSYRLMLPGQLVGKVIVRAEPPQVAGQPTGAAIAEIAEVSATTSSTAVDFHLPAGERAAVTTVVPVLVKDSGGQDTVVAGVTARLRFELIDDLTKQTLRYVAEGKSNDNGAVALKVVPGVIGTNWTYRLSLLPPADARLAAVFDEPVEIVPGGLVITPMLKERARITGRLLESARPMKGVTLTVRPSRAFLQELDTLKRTFVDEIAATTATTSKTGEFVVYADQLIAGVPARYSLTFQPPESAFEPTWTHIDEVAIAMGADANAVNVGDIFAVEPANVHGRIVNPGGRPVAKARVLIYKLDDTCLAQGCSSTAQLIGRGVADDDGVVRIALPKEP